MNSVPQLIWCLLNWVNKWSEELLTLPQTWPIRGWEDPIQSDGVTVRALNKICRHMIFGLILKGNSLTLPWPRPCQRIQEEKATLDSWPFVWTFHHMSPAPLLSPKIREIMSCPHDCNVVVYVISETTLIWTTFFLHTLFSLNFPCQDFCFVNILRNLWKKSSLLPTRTPYHVGLGRSPHIFLFWSFCDMVDIDHEVYRYRPLCKTTLYFTLILFFAILHLGRPQLGSGDFSF